MPRPSTPPPPTPVPPTPASWSARSTRPASPQYAVQEFGSRFRAISPYIQDNWKVSDRLTLDLGLRYDYFPTLRENKDNQSFFNPSRSPTPSPASTVRLQFAGNGANTCNCSTPVNQFYKNIGPRLGLAYQIDPETVLRASYGIMFTHGNGVGGSNQSVTGSASNALGYLRLAQLLRQRHAAFDRSVHRCQWCHPCLHNSPWPRFRPAVRHRLHHASRASPAHLQPSPTMTRTSAAARRSSSTGRSVCSTSGRRTSSRP